MRTKLIFAFLAICIFAPSLMAQTTCYAVTPSGAGSKNGSNWANAYAGIPATLTRGAIYYLGDGTYSSYTFSQAVSGTSTIEFRKAQWYDFGAGCATPLTTGWNVATMGSGQANLGGAGAAGSYVIFNGNGLQATPGCGGGGSNFTTGTNAQLIAAIEGPPPTPSDCGIKFTSFSVGNVSAAFSNITLKSTEVLCDSTPAHNVDVCMSNPGNTNITAITLTHNFVHNAAAAFLGYFGHSGTRTYNYWWGTEVQGPDNNGDHGQYDQECGSCGLSSSGSNNTVDAYSVFRDISGTAVWTFLTGGTVSGWQIYGNVIYNSSVSNRTSSTLPGSLSDATLDCINGVTCSGFTFSQNTTLNCDGLGLYSTQCGIGWGDSGGGSVTIENNLWYQINSGSVYITTGSASITEDHNSLVNVGTPGSGFNSASDVKVASGSANPFVNWQAGNFALASENTNWNGRTSISPTVDLYRVIYTSDRGVSQYFPASTGCGATNSWVAQACQNISSGSVGPWWTVISRHGEYAQSETECNIPGQLAQATGALTFTTKNTAYTCGNFNSNGTVNTSPTSFPYSTADVQMSNFSFTPGTCPTATGCASCAGTCTVSWVAKMPSSATSLWPAFWLLDYCYEPLNPYSGETPNGGCPAFGNSGYTEIDWPECLSGDCNFHVANPGQGLGTGCDVNGTWDTNVHTWKIVWTATNVKGYMDSTLVGNCNTAMTTPMFAIYQIQTGGVGGTPVNGDLPASMVVNSVSVVDANGVTLFSDAFSQGSSTPGVNFSPTSAAFGNVPDGSAATPIPVTLTNTGTASLTISAMNISGTNASDFGFSTVPSSNCSGSIAAAGTCTLTFTFTPSAVGARSGTFSMSDNASGSPHTIPLSGTGILTPAATPTFSPVAGTYGSAQNVTISTTSTGAIICWNTTGAPATNGTTGCTTGTKYTGAISVNGTQTIYAVAGGTGYSDSPVGSATYTLPVVATPSLFARAQ